MLKREDIFLKELRERTANAHQKLEENRFSRSIVNENISEADYITFLSRFYGFVLPLENSIYTNAEKYLPDAASRKRAQLLYNDLLNLGLTEQNIKDLPLCSDMPEFDETISSLGAMYVFEGSTLGGQVISRHLQKALPYISDKSITFFKGHGKETGPMWKKFLDNFCETAVTENKQEEIISVSENTFLKFYNWLQQA